MQYVSEELVEKWTPVLEHADLLEIKDAHRRSVTATLLENQQRASRESAQGSGGYSMPTLLGEASPINSMGTSAAPSTSPSGNVDIFDPVLISLVRRSMPNLIAYDIAGVQPMTGPTGLIFAMRSNYVDSTNNTIKSEAMFDEADTDFSGTGAHDGTTGSGATANTGTGMATSTAEQLGSDNGNAFQEM